MQTAISDLQTRFRSLFRPYFRDGDPTSGLNEPDLEAIRVAFGTQLIAILARQLVGPVGAEYPEFPAAASLAGKVFFLDASGESPVWGLIPAADVARAAELVDFEAGINAEIASRVQDFIDAIIDDAPFNERFEDEATLLADLDYPDNSYAINMETLVIYRKTGGVGAGSWAVHSNVLDAFPGTASGEDLDAANARIDDNVAEIAAIKLRLNRLDAAVPPIPPVWRLVPDVIVDETFTGTVRDLAAYVDDADSPAENLIFTAPGGLPAGFSITGRNLIKTSTSGIVARASFALSVTDESGNVATDGTVVIQAYPDGDPPSLPPVWATLPALTAAFGSPLTFALTAYLSDADTDLVDVEVRLAAPVTGISVNSGAKTITFTGLAVGTHAFTLEAEDDDSNITSVTHSITITSAAAPVWGFPPSRSGQVGGAAITVDLNPFVSDANTPASELGTSLVFSNAPSGTTKGGTNNLVLTIPVAAQTVRAIALTVTNRAGLSASRSFDITIAAAPATGGGGGGPGGGDRIVF